MGDLNYKILGKLQDILRERGVDSRLHHSGQSFRKPECLEFAEPQWFNSQKEREEPPKARDPPLCIIVDGHIKIIRQLLDIPDFKNPLVAATVELYSEDLSDPYSIEKIMVFILSNWSGDADNSGD